MMQRATNAPGTLASAAIRALTARTCLLAYCGVLAGCFLDAAGSPLEDGGAPLGGAGPATATGGGGFMADTGGAGGQTSMETSCPGTELATGVQPNGQLACTSVEELATKAIGASCKVHYGWADQCDDCANPPTKWGWVMDSDCDTSSQDCNCQMDELGDQTVQLLGINLDGQVGPDDKFYTSLTCGSGADLADCAASGQLLVGFDADGKPQCMDPTPAVLDAVRTGCGLLSGWRDDCEGCDSPPVKLGRSTSVACDPGTNEDNLCTNPTLGDESVQMLGIDPDDNVDQDDQFYLGLRCDDVKTADTKAVGSCPAGSFVAGITASGELSCRSVASHAVDAFRAHCRVYFGWRDLCEGNCTSPPSKWGWASDGDCGLAPESQDVCVDADFGSETVRLVGINTGFGVDGNDKFFVGFQCR